MSLVSLVYVSRSAQPMSDADLKDILAEARDKNAAKGITGMLLYRDDFFVQALEGDKAAVQTTYEKICKDPRHTRILKLYEHPLKVRAYENWSMGFNKIDDEDLEHVEGFTDFLTQPLDANYMLKHPSHTEMLLTSFRRKTLF